MFLEVALCIFVILLFILFGNGKKKPILPKGPPCLPIVGNGIDIALAKLPHLKFSDWANKYGDLYTIKLGSMPVLIVNEVRLAKKLLSHFEATKKFDHEPMHMLSGGGPFGISHTEGKDWMEQRAFANAALKEFGIGRQTTEEFLLSSVQEFINWMLKEMKTSPAVPILNETRVTLNNAIWQIISSQKFDLRDAASHTYVPELFEAMNRSVKKGYFFIPFLKHIIPDLSGYTDLKMKSDRFHSFVKAVIAEHKTSIVPNSPRDIIDLYLDHQSTITDPKSSFYGEFGIKNNDANIAEMFAGGAEGVTRVMQHMFLHLAHNHNIQDKVRTEIDDVIGRYRQPTLIDRKAMPYTDALIHETLRVATILPFGELHELMGPVEYEGYHLEKGLLILINMYNCHYREDVWGDPHTFRPERFLGKEGDALKIMIIPFMTGRRKCIGSHITKDMMFLFTTKLFQNVVLHPDPNKPVPDYTPITGFGLFLKMFSLKVEERV